MYVKISWKHLVAKIFSLSPNNYPTPPPKKKKTNPYNPYWSNLFFVAKILYHYPVKRYSKTFISIKYTSLRNPIVKSSHFNSINSRLSAKAAAVFMFVDTKIGLTLDIAVVAMSITFQAVKASHRKLSIPWSN